MVSEVEGGKVGSAWPIGESQWDTEKRTESETQ